jgi:hypothetical protein
MEDRGPIRQLDSNEFLFSFKRHKVERLGLTRRAAVAIYLQEKGLIPSQCLHGIDVLRDGDQENGNGWATFICSRRN